MADITNRHQSVQEKMRWLEPNPSLPPHLKGISEAVASLADRLLGMIPGDNPQLTIGLQHLVDAKDCLVRARIAADDPKPS